MIWIMLVSQNELDTRLARAGRYLSDPIQSIDCPLEYIFNPFKLESNFVLDIEEENI